MKVKALHHMCAPLERAEQLSYQYMQRKGDRILIMDGTRQQRAELERMESDAVNYVHRQIRTQVIMYQKQANKDLYDTMMDCIYESIENEKYYLSLQHWAESAVQKYLVAQQRDTVKHDKENKCNTVDESKKDGDIDSLYDTSITGTETGTATGTDHPPRKAGGAACDNSSVVPWSLLSSNEEIRFRC